MQAKSTNLYATQLRNTTDPEPKFREIYNNERSA
jgi:hypothetical protein